MQERRHELVTVGISCFNSEKTIERAIQSALNQTWPTKEIVIVDDASTDNTPTILKRFERSHNVRVYYKMQNTGVGQTRNDILNNANGNFISFFDDDDESDPLRVATQIWAILNEETDENDGHKIVCFTGRNFIGNAKAKYVAPIRKLGGRNKSLIAGEKVANFILAGINPGNIRGSTATCTLTGRLSVIKSLGGFDKKFTRSEDTEFAARAGLQGAKFLSINCALVTQYQTSGKEKSYINELNNSLLYIEKHKNYINKISSAHFCKEWIKFKFFLKDKTLGNARKSFLKLLFLTPRLLLSRAWSSLKSRILGAVL